MDDHGAADIDDLSRAWALTNLGEVPQPRAGADERPSAEVESAAAALAEEFNPNGSEDLDSVLPEEPGPGELEPAAGFPTGGEEIELPGGLRLRSVVVETPVEKDVPVFAEHITFERRTADREATEADFQAFEQGVMDLVEFAEELVVSKKARVVEEVVITKKLRETTATVRENLKRTHLTATFPSGPGSSS